MRVGAGGRENGSGCTCAFEHVQASEDRLGAHFVVGNAVVAQHRNEDEGICGAVVLDDVYVGVHTKNLHPPPLLLRLWYDARSVHHDGLLH